MERALLTFLYSRCKLESFIYLGFILKLHRTKMTSECSSGSQLCHKSHSSSSCEEDLQVFSLLINISSLLRQHTLCTPQHVRWGTLGHRPWPQCSAAHGAPSLGLLEGRDLGDSCVPSQGTKSATCASQLTNFPSNNTLKYLHTNIHKHMRTQTFQIHQQIIYSLLNIVCFLEYRIPAA